MSANICDDRTFSVLKAFAVDRIRRGEGSSRGVYVYGGNHKSAHDARFIPSTNYLPADDVVACLYAENVHSVNVRYNERHIALAPTFKPESYQLADVAAAIRRLEYNSCEANDYYQTYAYQVLTALKNQLLSALIEQVEACA